jgi:hypothetical protein
MYFALPVRVPQATGQQPNPPDNRSRTESLLKGFADASDPLALAQVIDMFIEGALIIPQNSPDSDVCTVASRVAETLLEKYLAAEA